MGESRFTAPLVLSATLLAALLGLVLWCGGLAGAAYFGLYLLALLPGLPIGWRLFGRGGRRSGSRHSTGCSCD